MLDKINLVKELKKDFGFDNFQIVDLLNGAHYKDIVILDESLINLYNNYCQDFLYWGKYRPIDELDDFLDTLNGSFAFKLCENADDLSNGVREYFAYNGEQLFFCSLNKLIEDMNNDEDFRDYLDDTDYFTEAKTRLREILKRNFDKVEI